MHIYAHHDDGDFMWNNKIKYANNVASSSSFRRFQFIES